VSTWLDADFALMESMTNRNGLVTVAQSGMVSASGMASGDLKIVSVSEGSIVVDFVFATTVKRQTAHSLVSSCGVCFFALDRVVCPTLVGVTTPCNRSGACESNPCLHGGTCVPGATAQAFTCHCPPDHPYAPTCLDTYTPSAANSAASGSGGLPIVAIAAAAGGLLVLVLLVVAAVLYRRRQPVTEVVVKPRVSIAHARRESVVFFSNPSFANRETDRPFDPNYDDVPMFTSSTDAKYDNEGFGFSSAGVEYEEMTGVSGGTNRAYMDVAPGPDYDFAQLGLNPSDDTYFTIGLADESDPEYALAVAAAAGLKSSATRNEDMQTYLTLGGKDSVYATSLPFTAGASRKNGDYAVLNPALSGSSLPQMFSGNYAQAVHNKTVEGAEVMESNLDDPAEGVFSRQRTVRKLEPSHDYVDTSAIPLHLESSNTDFEHGQALMTLHEGGFGFSEDTGDLADDPLGSTRTRARTFWEETSKAAPPKKKEAEVVGAETGFGDFFAEDETEAPPMLPPPRMGANAAATRVSSRPFDAEVGLAFASAASKSANNFAKKAVPKWAPAPAPGPKPKLAANANVEEAAEEDFEGFAAMGDGALWYTDDNSAAAFQTSQFDLADDEFAF
jgi:hypothetical protein